MLSDRASESIQELHNSRLLKYAETIDVPFENAIVRLIHLHKKGVNIAEHISKIIGVNHVEYIRELHQLGEYTFFIR